MYTIYKHTSPSGKSYIVLTKHGIDKRLKAHINEALVKNSQYKFHKAIRKYGKENIISEVLIDNVKTIDEANELEKYYISFFDTFKNGYNMTNGGTLEITASMIEKGRISRERVCENGLTIAKNNGRKAVITRKSTILENGLTIEENCAIKRRSTVMLKIDGESIADKNVKKALETKRSTIIDGKNLCQLASERGAETWKNIKIKNPEIAEAAYNATMIKFNTITENGKTLAVNTSIKGVKTRALNGYANIINIYDDKDELRFECFGNFGQVCKENNLPLLELQKSFRTNTKVLENYASLRKCSQTMHKNNGNLQFKDWYAKLIEDEVQLK